jgi:hypothetical protein
MYGLSYIMCGEVELLGKTVLIIINEQLKKTVNLLTCMYDNHTKWIIKRNNVPTV